MIGVRRDRLNSSFGTPTRSNKGRHGLLLWRGQHLKGPCSPANPATPASPCKHLCPPGFGTPGYPSPLDRVRLRKVESPRGNASFSHLPRHHHHHLSLSRVHHPTASLPRLTAMTGDGLHSYSFSPGVVKGSFSVGRRDTPSSAYPGHWLYRTFVGGGGAAGHSSSLPSSVLNPNKAIFTLDASSRILTTNDMCSLLLGEAEEKLCGGSRRLSDFISCPVTARYLASLAPDTTTTAQSQEELPVDLVPSVVPGYDAADGKGAIFSGRVVNVETMENGSQLCSLWLKGLPREVGQEQRWMAVLEPIEVTQAKATVDYSGAILDNDEAFRALFGFPDTVLISHLENIHNLIPSLQLPSPPPTSTTSTSSSTSSSSSAKHPSVLPMELEQQQCTGVSVEGSSTFPLCVQLSHHLPQPHSHTSHTPALNLDISVFSNISGLVVLDSSGNISDYNYNFTRFLFGYGHGELDGQSISLIIPSIYEDMKQTQEEGYEEEVSTGSYWEEEDEEEEEELEVELEVELVEEEEENKEVQKENKEKGEKHSKAQIMEQENSKPSNNNNTTTTTTTTTTAASHSLAMRDITNSLNAVELKSQPQQHCLYNTWLEEKSSDEKQVTQVNQVTQVSKESLVNKINKTPASLITSTPAAKPCLPARPLADPIHQGTFFGVGRHKDGSDLRVIYQIRRVVLDTLEKEEDEEEEVDVEQMRDTEGGGGGTVFYYMWILNDRDGIVDDAPSTLDLTFTSLHDTTELSLGHAITREAREPKKQEQEEEEEKERQQKNKKKKEVEEDEEVGDETVDSSYCPSFTSSSDCGGDGEHSHTCTDGSSGAEYSLNHSRRGARHSSSSAPEEEKDVPEEGEFSQHYQVLKQIGKGAFGCVKLSHRCSDGLLVVTKFIKKSKVYKDSWVDDMVLERRVPLEVSLLMSLEHPNIVTVLDVFENDKYFQLVMEKLGSGMDLFEFIDRNPKLDEFLAAHIFRQIVAALTYLHSLDIVHRDVKDENVIMDNRFHVKLIDFGSSAFTAPGKKFSQFAGTVEYCSPEVLMGNKYTGYEVEVWSLGVTLYTLMYWENPFYDVDETIKGVLNIPYEHSPELTSLLKGMMEKDVSARLTLPQVEKHPWTQLPCNPDQYTFHHVVHCSKRERNPKHYLRDYIQNGEDTAASSRSFLDEELLQNQPVSTPPPVPIRRANSATTPRRPTHPGKNRDRLWSATPLSVCPTAATATATATTASRSPKCVPDRCCTPSAVSCSTHSTHSRASTTHSLSSIRSTITVDSASFSACSPHSSSPSSTTSPSSSSSPSTTPTTATASDWANTQCKSTCVSSTCPDSSAPLSDSTPTSDSGSSHSTLDDPCCPLSPCPADSTCHHHHHHHTSSGDQHHSLSRSHGSSSCEGSQGACHSSRDASCCSDHCSSWQEGSMSLSSRTKQDFLTSLFSYSSSSASSSSSSSSSCSSSSSSSSPESSPHKSQKSSNSAFNSDALFYSEPFSFSDLLSLTDLDLMEGVLPHPCDSLWDDSTPDSP